MTFEVNFILGITKALFRQRHPHAWTRVDCEQLPQKGPKLVAVFGLGPSPNPEAFQQKTHEC